MKIHTTNYQNTFIEVAEDCPTAVSQIPPKRENVTLADIQYEMISKNPYRYHSDDVVFECYAKKRHLTDEDKPGERVKFFSKGQPCLRSSALCKRYGFGIYHNHEGKVAIFAVESDEYLQFLNDRSVTKVKAMRSKKNDRQIE